MTDTTPAAAKTYTMEYLVGALILGLILGVLVSWIWLDAAPDIAKTPSPALRTVQENSTDTTQTEDALEPASTVFGSEDRPLIINDQSAGLIVFVAKADVGENNWVVIHEDRMGQPGRALGAGRFVGGATSGAIELLRGTLAGQMYHGLIYKDDGDRIFSMERDVPLRDMDGTPVVATFKTN